MSGGELVVIKRSGRDGMRYPMPSGCVRLGRDADCHIRVLLPTVSQLHASVTVHRNQSVITNESSTGATLVNGAPVSVRAFRHGDIITLGDRSLRWEYYRPADVRTDNPPPELQASRGRRRRGKGGGRARASDAAPRRLEPEVKALMDMRHRASIPGGERQVAIVQPQRRGESASEPAEIKTKAPAKPTNKRASRAAKAGPSSAGDPIRKSARGANSPSSHLDTAAGTSKAASPRKSAKKPAEPSNDADESDTPKNAKNTRNSKNNQIDEETSPKKTTPKKQEPSKKTIPKKDEAAKKKTPLRNKSELTKINIGLPRKSGRTPTVDILAAKRGSLRSTTPRKVSTPTKSKLGADFSNVTPTDLAVVAARGTPKRATPKGPFVHVATPRPKTPYVELSPSWRSKIGNALGAPRVNPLLRAVTATRTPRSVTKKPASPKPASPRKRDSVEKIEDPTIIDEQKKSALMALTGRSPKRGLNPSAPSAKFVISKASIKKISPSRSTPASARTGRRKRTTATPKLTPGAPRAGGSRRYTSASDVDGGRQRVSLRKSAVSDTEITNGTPTKLQETNSSQSSPTRSTRRTLPTTPPTVRVSEPSPRKSVLKRPSSNSPRKSESIKFDLSNLERKRSESLPPSPRTKDPPKTLSPRKRGRSSVTSVDTTSEEDLLLRYSTDGSTGSESPSPRRSIHSRSKTLDERVRDTSVSSGRVSRTRSPLTKSPVTPKKSTRGTFTVQNVLDTPVAMSPSPSDQSVRNTYSRRSTLTKTRVETSYTAQSSSDVSNNVTQTGTPNVQSPRSTRQRAMESYSIVDLVSIDSTPSVDETDTSYDSASSVNSIYKTPTARQTSFSRGRSLVSLSLETSTPLANRASRLSTRNALLKSATIASAIKRSRSTPNTATKVSSPSRSTRNTPSKTPTRRSKSLSLSPKLVNETLEKGGPRIKTQIIIDDSVTDSNDTTITPSVRTSRSNATPTYKVPFPPNNTPVQSPKLSRRSNKPIEKFPEVSLTQSLSKSEQSPAPGPSGRSSRSGQTPVDTRKSASPISTSKKSRRKSPTPKSSPEKSARKSASPKILSSKSSKSPSPNKRRTVSLNDVSASKRRLTFRSSKSSPRRQTDKAGGGDGSVTPEHVTSTLEAGTPVLHIQDLLNRSRDAINKSIVTLASVKVTVQRIEALNTPKTAERLRKMTRKTLGGIGERILARRSDLKVQSGIKAWSDTKRKAITKAKTGVKANLGAFKKILSSDQGNSDDNSVSSDKTDENAPRPDNEIVITPKSSIQPIPEAVKEKHSTAKKSTSRKSIIDHLNESQEIAKQLFNSPVKRKLSRSMTHYSQVSEDEPSTSRRSGSKRSTFGKTPNVSFDFDSVKTPRVPTEFFVSPMDTPFPSSPNLVGVRRLYKNTPRNDLTNVRGVRALLKTPGAKKSPRNDLTDVAGVKSLFGSGKKGKSPKNDLTKISGVKQLLGSTRSQRSAKNDLTQVIGVKQLFESGSKKQKSPQNDLRNVAGVKNLLTSPKGKQKSPKNDLTDVRGVRSVFRRDRSIRNALDDVSGVEELFSNTNSTVRDSDNTMTEFDKLVGGSPKKMYGRAKSMAGKKTTPAKLRPTKSMEIHLSRNNVEEWINQEIEIRTNARKVSSSKKSVSNKLSTSLQDTSKASIRTPNKSIKISQPKSARVERALKKLAIDAVVGNIAITPDRRSRRTITADKSSYSVEVAKALTPTKNRASNPKMVVELNSLPFKKRGHSNEKASKATKRKRTEEVNLDDSTEAMGLNDVKDRLLLPIKKRVQNHEALGHSTPVKKKARSTKADDVDSVDLGPVSPIATSPNVTPRKNTSLRGARETAEQTKEVIRPAEKQTKNDSIQEPPPKVTKSQRGKAQESTTTTEETESPSTDKAVPKTRGRRSVKKDTANATEATTSPKRPTRGRKAVENKQESPKKVVGKNSPKISPKKPTATTTRGCKTAQVQEEPTLKSPEKIAPKTRGRRGRKDTSLKADTSYPSLVVGKKAPKMSPEKPQPKTRTKRGVDKVSQTDLSPRKAEPKTRGRKIATPKKASPKETSTKKASPKETSTKKASPKETSTKKASPKKTRGKTAQKAQEGSESSGKSTPVQSRRKRANEKVESPKNKVTRGGRAKATPVESPKDRRGKRVQTSDQKRVRFAVEEPQTPVQRSGGRRKAEPIGEEEGSKPQAKRGRASRTTVELIAPTSEAGRTTRRSRPAAATSAEIEPTQGRATRQRK